MSGDRIPADATRILTSGEVCAMLRVSRQTLHRMTKRGDLPHYRVGGLLRFNADDVADYLASARVGGAS